MPKLELTSTLKVQDVTEEVTRLVTEASVLGRRHDNWTAPATG